MMMFVRLHSWASASFQSQTGQSGNETANHYDVTTVHYFWARSIERKCCSESGELEGERWRMTLSPRSRPRKEKRLNSLCAISTPSKCKVGRS